MKNYTQQLDKIGAKLLIAYQKKEKNSIHILLTNLEEERNNLRENINAITHLINLVEKHQIEIEKKTLKISNHQDIKKWYSSLSTIFKGLHLSKKDSLSKEEIEFIKLELPKLEAQKENQVKQLMYVDSIIVKTVVLLNNLRNEICIQLTDGKDLKIVSKDLKNSLGDTIKGNYYSSSQLIISFLENNYQLNKIESRELFNLLDKNKAIEYHIEIPENDLFRNYKEVGLEEKYVPIDGAWKVN